MTRKLEDLYTNVFSRLQSELPADRDTTDLKLGPTHQRRIRLSVDHRELLIRLKHTKYHCLPSVSMYWLTYQGSLGHKYFAILPESYRVTALIGGFGETPFEDAILPVLWGELDTPSRNIPNLSFRIYDEIFGIDGDYEVELLRTFFDPLQVIEIDPHRWGDEANTPYRVFGRCLIEALGKKDHDLPLTFSSDTLHKVRFLVEDIPIIGHAVFKAITCTHWEHAFLEFYRCAERVYTAPYITALRDSLMDGASDPNMVSFLEGKMNSALGTYMEHHFTWRPKEEDALIKLLSSVDPLISRDLANTLGVASGKPENVGRALYKVRNRIAHWRPIHDGGINTPWDKLIGNMCDFIYEIYASFSGITVVENL